VLKYVRLSNNSGLKVSALCLGTWHIPRLSEKDEFGVHGIDVDEFRRILRFAYDSGINFIDTANRYHGAIAPVPLTHVGYAEKLLGRLIRELGIDRESLVVSTKVAGEMAPWPNGRGLSRKHVMWQIRESLSRLGLSYIDIYYAHSHDPETPKREVMSTFNDLVRSGYVRYIGMSNIPAHDLVEYEMIAEDLGFEPITVLQYRYNWLERDVERDIIQIAKRFGMGLTAYSPLAQGVLAGRYIDPRERRWAIPDLSRATYYSDVKRYFTEENLRRVLAFIEVARSKGVTPAQLAIAWLLKRSEMDGVPIIPIVGVSRRDQLEELLGGLEVRLGNEDLKHLSEIYSNPKI